MSDDTINLIDIIHTCTSVWNYSTGYHIIRPTYGLMVSNSFYNFYCRALTILTRFLIRCNFIVLFIDPQ